MIHSLAPPSKSYLPGQAVKETPIEYVTALRCSLKTLTGKLANLIRLHSHRS
jgi:hypothetical protein